MELSCLLLHTYHKRKCGNCRKYSKRKRIKTIVQNTKIFQVCALKMLGQKKNNTFRQLEFKNKNKFSVSEVLTTSSGL